MWKEKQNLTHHKIFKTCSCAAYIKRQVPQCLSQGPVKPKRPKSFPSKLLCKLWSNNWRSHIKSLWSNQGTVIRRKPTYLQRHNYTRLLETLSFQGTWWQQFLAAIQVVKETMKKSSTKLFKINGDGCYLS